MKHMKKVLALLLALCVLSTAAVAFGPQPPFENIKHLRLVEKDPVTWEPVPGGASGFGIWARGRFMFQARGLEPDTTYTLIRYTDPWPGTPVACLGEATTKTHYIPGRTWRGHTFPDRTFVTLHMRGRILPGGPKVWLVLSDDVDCDAQKMTGWNPSEYLFETRLV